MKTEGYGFLDILVKSEKHDLWNSSFVPMTKDMLTPELEVKLKSKLRTIPPLPNILNQLLVIMDDVKISSRKIAGYASKDPVLAGKILQLVNSSFFGVKKEVKSINTAVILLGINNVKNFIFQSSVSKIFKGFDEIIFSLEDFWNHSLATSVCAYHLSTGIPGMTKEDISTTALLHDLGKVVMAALEPDKYKNFIDTINENPFIPTIVIEEEVFGLNHALLGSLLVEIWNLPDDISKTIMYHHSPPFVTPDKIPQDCRKSVVVVHFADMISKMCDHKQPDRDLTAISEDYFDLIGKKPPLELMLDNDIAQEIQQVRIFAK
jgi:putative nucleotidyltransferase with HDIG domain